MTQQIVPLVPGQLVSIDDTTRLLGVAGSFSASAPVGGATEAKQDTQIANAGGTIDATRAADYTTAEGAGASTHTSLLKRLVNLLIAIYAKFATHGVVVQGDASGTAIPISGSVTTSGTVTEASAAAILTALKNLDVVISEQYEITIPATTTLLTALLTTAKGSTFTFGSNLVAVKLIPTSSDGPVYYTLSGAATSSSGPWERDAIPRPFTATVAAAIQIIGAAAGTDKAVVEIFTPRN